MKKAGLLLFSILLVCADSFSQTQWPKVFEITADTVYFQQLDTAYWQILEDKSAQFALDEVKTLQAAGKFKPFNQQTDRTAPAYWIVYKLHNMLSRQAQIALNSMSDFDDFYLETGTGHQQHFRSGKLVDKAEKDGYKITNCIPIKLEAGETCTIYQRVENKIPGIPANFMVSILSTDQVLENYYINRIDNYETIYSAPQLQEAFIIGMIFLAVFMNLFFYRIVQEKLYLYFALAACFLAINRMYNITSAYLFYKNPGMHGILQILTLAWLFITYFFVQFYRSFLNLKQRFPVLDKLFIGTAWLFIAVTIIRWLARKYELDALNWVGKLSVSMVFLIIPGMEILVQLVSLKKAPKANYYLLAGSLPLLLLEISSMFFSQEGFQLFNKMSGNSWLTRNYRFAEAICLAILLLSITWVLFLRFIELRKQNAQQALDKEKLAREKEIERNELIATQKIKLEQEVAERTAELQQSLKDLKTTQVQLVQSEKMAALGELTAGIAHEIQNPLNFVNNFSEVSVELVDEMKAELDKGETAEAAAIAGDIQQNLQKIAHHGKRAESIVKGMLQHSRNSTGMKEPTDINALCDECLRLSFHGLRAKDKQFNAAFTTDFDTTIGTIAVIPQDISRVLLNLYNNAFFAVHEKQQTAAASYAPAVQVTTKKQHNAILISVTDNGNGIPESISHKIFQPFFTTKPTGEGTGLGLSLSYDIIKAHNGEITVESKEGEGTTFMVELPFS